MWTGKEITGCCVFTETEENTKFGVLGINKNIPNRHGWFIKAFIVLDTIVTCGYVAHHLVK